jgi:PAS domain S-box-containing protein
VHNRCERKERIDVRRPPLVPQPRIELEEFFDLSIDLLCIVGFDGCFKRVNRALARTLGYPKPELLARSALDITHPDDVEPSRAALAQLAEGHDLVGFESRVITADGTVRWLEWNTRTVPERGVVYGVARDTTERRRADAALREARVMLEASRDERSVLAEEQAALRRVATLVARETPPDAVLAAVAREVGEVLGVDATHLGRYDPDGTVVSVAQWGAGARIPIGARFPLEGDSVSARVLRTGRPARMDGYGDAPGVVAAAVRSIGIRYSIGVPIPVAGRSWGVMIVSTRAAEPFPAETEARLRHFTELLATAISNASARDKLRALADEQAALRRVATLVARQTPQGELFATIAEEIGRMLRVDSIEMIRYEDDRFAAPAAGWGSAARAVPDGTRVPLGGRNVTSLVFETRRAARLEDYGDASGPIGARAGAGGVRSAVGTPIFVEGRLWGVMVAASTQGPALPADTELRMGQFTELMATAIANAEARAEVARLAAEQAALRRVATLVAEDAAPSTVFDAVTAEVTELLAASSVSLARYDDDAVTVVAQRGEDAGVPLGQRPPPAGAGVTDTVRRTGSPARLDELARPAGPIAGAAGHAGVRTTVAAPVVVNGRTWGALAAAWIACGPPAEDAAERLARFAELLDAAIANADSREQLTASRARVLAAGDEARRRVVRDLHDGAQQRLVHTIVTLKLARQALRDGRPNAEALVAEGLGDAEGAIADLRELAHGILPAGLIRGGLSAAVDAFVSRLELPVDVEISIGRLPRDVEASAYFIVAEALTNVVKHARATRAGVRAEVDARGVRVEVRDDGVGGADPEGYGLVGVADRVDALGGELVIESGDRGGTVLVARLPLST